MYEISSLVYHEIADRLMAAIGGKEYFSGSVCYVSGDTEYRLICSLVIEHGAPASEGRSLRPVTALIPVWWEFHTFVSGEELLNDFSFGEFVATII